MIAAIKKDPCISKFAYVTQDSTIDIVVDGVECDKPLASSYAKRNNLKLLVAKIQESLFAGLTEISVITDDPETLANCLRIFDIAHANSSVKVEVTVVGFKARIREIKTYQSLYRDIKCATLLFPGEAS